MSVWPLSMSAGMNNNDPWWARRTFCELATAIYKKYFLSTKELCLSTQGVTISQGNTILLVTCFRPIPLYSFPSTVLVYISLSALLSTSLSLSVITLSILVSHLLFPYVFSPFSTSPFSSSRPCSHCLRLSFYTAVIFLTFSSPFLLSLISPPFFFYFSHLSPPL